MKYEIVIQVHKYLNLDWLLFNIHFKEMRLRIIIKNPFWKQYHR